MKKKTTEEKLAILTARLYPKDKEMQTKVVESYKRAMRIVKGERPKCKDSLHDREI